MLDTIVAAAVEAATTNDNDREWAAARPDRSVSAVRSASTVPARWRAFAACVLHRESGATLDRPQSGSGARNTSGSSAQGRWQMLDASGWRSGGAWNVYKRLVRYGTPKAQAHDVRNWLATHPIAQWDGIWQDMAAIETLEAGGWRHWYAPGSRCNGLVP